MLFLTCKRTQLLPAARKIFAMRKITSAKKRKKEKEKNNICVCAHARVIFRYHSYLASLLKEKHVLREEYTNVHGLISILAADNSPKDSPKKAMAHFKHGVVV